LKYFFFILLLSISSGVYACRCIELSPEESFERSGIVVKGKIEAVALLPNYDGSISILKVEKTWKKNSLNAIGIISLTNCSFVFEKEIEYFVFLKRDKYGLYSTDKCSGNKTAKDSNKMSDWLNSINSSSD